MPVMEMEGSVTEDRQEDTCYRAGEHCQGMGIIHPLDVEPTGPDTKKNVLPTVLYCSFSFSFLMICLLPSFNGPSTCLAAYLYAFLLAAHLNF